MIGKSNKRASNNLKTPNTCHFKNPKKNIDLEREYENLNISVPMMHTQEGEENKFDDKLDITEACENILLLEEQVLSAHNKKSELNQYYDLTASNDGLNSNNLISSRFIESKGLSIPLGINNSNISRFPPAESQLTPKRINSLMAQSYDNNTFINNTSQIVLSSSQSSSRGIAIFNIDNKHFII